jgi:uncharacterized protein
VADFANPFSGNVPGRKMTNEELVRAIRLNLAAEQEATFQYAAHADATDNALAKKVLLDIADEERVHVGEFSRLLQILTGDEDQLLAQGRQEVDEMAAQIGLGASSAPNAGGSGNGNGNGAETPTVGSLRG